MKAMNLAFPSPSVPASSTGSRQVSPADLNSLPVFANLDSKFLEGVAAAAEYVSFQPGEILLAQGDIADRMYAIVGGRVRVDRNLSDSRLLIAEVGAGEVIGFSWLFTPEKVHFNVRCVEPVTAIAINAALLRKQCEACTSVGYQVAVRVGEAMVKRLEFLVALIAGEKHPSDL